MNIKNILIGSALAVSSIFGGVTGAEARPNRIVSDTTSNGTYVAFKPVGYSGVEVVVNNPYSKTGFIGNMNCSTGGYQWRSNDGWSQSEIRGILIDACNF